MGHGPQQLLRVRLLRAAEHVPGITGLDDAPPVHHDHPVGEIRDDTHVVGDQQDARIDPVAQVAQQLQDLCLHRHVERCGGFVGDQHPRVERERLGDHRPLALAARQLVRVGIDPARGIGDLDQLEQLDRPTPRGLRCHGLVAAQHLCDLEPDRVHGVERGHRFLEDHRHRAAADRPQCALIRPEELAVAEVGRPDHMCVSRQQAEQCERRRRLARSGLAHDGDDLAAVQVERGVGDGRVPRPVDPEVDAESTYRQHGSGGHGRPRSR